MVNFNGTLVPSSENILVENRAFLYGDGIFETVKILDGKVLFLEDHYFRLMSGMRIVRMKIPMDFTMEFFESQLLETAAANNCLDSGRVRITVYRNAGGFYLPTAHSVGFAISAIPLENKVYAIVRKEYEVDLFKDFYITKQLLSSVKTTNKLINITGSIYADENALQNCLLLNDSKTVVEALNGNVFMLSGSKLVTPPLSEGCLNGVMRRQILAIAKKVEGIEVSEEIISPFDLQKADEIFITNVITGIQPVTKYRKKDFRTAFAESLLVKLNAQIRFS
ncbi:aminotransferase class IV [Flavobacterium noncentrifugens]|uniref:branched-chain-amino-acid transaminase n=1 Tax=Flavobacterium noncentrifugens TaxID=1128970 RepID=A0A1G9CNN1_9FLAO|nr:aminotransferase class IV [Flavobacterium noncentrifugens]GEP52100.1 aminotransferase class IV [Flavobacterium noncentrifugens]SDK53189.1 branched-chain amino acid aminotransferase [Flavobacterium noncentrifugens]